MKKDAPNAEEKVRAIKEQIVALGPMRPGKLSVQYHKPIEKAQAFYQISYTIQKRSRSDYVREADLERVLLQLFEVERDTHRHALHDLDPVTGGVLRGQQRKGTPRADT